MENFTLDISEDHIVHFSCLGQSLMENETLKVLTLTGNIPELARTGSNPQRSHSGNLTSSDMRHLQIYDNVLNNQELLFPLIVGLSCHVGLCEVNKTTNKYYPKIPNKGRALYSRSNIFLPTFDGNISETVHSIYLKFGVLRVANVNY